MSDDASAAASGGTAGGDVVLASAGYDHTIRFWEALSGLCVRTINYPDSQINRLAISPDKRFLVAAGNPHVRLFDVQSNNPNPISTFDGHKGNVTAVAYQAAGRWIVTGSEDGTVKVWDVRAPTPQRDLPIKHPVSDCVIHPNLGELISCDASGSVRVWDLGETRCTLELVPEEDVAARSVAVNSDGSVLVAANNKGRFFVWRLKSGGGAITVEGSPAGMGGSGKGSGTGADVNGDVQAGEAMVNPLQKVQAHSKYITKAVMSPDTNVLATCSADHTVKTWRLVSDPSHPAASTHPTLTSLPEDTDEEVGFLLDRTLQGHQRWVWDAAFSADSAYLVTGSSDHTARLWDLASGETIRHYNGHQKAVVCVALHDVSL
ncbi:WD40 repeat-like protein [Gonapodya prolifera JEL478]|uniref:Target of rapamycin complex subunit LST8 n=1 Tax=Gonapodya prolifera (strain JEL478) TaxID=1344416 RepID=A0A139A4Z6_GONPJ|nr:WD40 repeat-like protein [Gonapodya prolifera JEL478]|eukprot:KXS11860.1 WD40 repeat-like protein [Gonapodya prolifera JEL478]